MSCLLFPQCCEPSTFESDVCPESLADPYPGQPKPYGRVHPTIQQVEAIVNDVESLRQYLRTDDPLLNWQTSSGRREIDLCNPKSWFPKDNHVAFYSPSSDPNCQYDQLTYHQLHKAMDQCPPFLISGQNTPNVAIVLPVDQMAHMAMALLSIISTGAVAIPLDPRMPTLRLVEAMEQMKCDAFVALESILLGGKLPLLQSNGDKEYKLNPLVFQNTDYGQQEEIERLKSYFELHVEEIRMVICGVCGRLEWTILEKLVSEDGITWTVKSCEANDCNVGYSASSSPKDTAILLRTSGTTNKPKVVPISNSMLVYAGISIASALQLKRNDCNCNSMPFYHIGGIACNLFAVLLSGGSVIMAGALTNPDAFLNHLVIKPEHPISATWYYAAPSMHKAIVLMAEARSEANGHNLPNKLRFVRSASAHLSHDLALRLSKVFECQVIPTYGMTEAMPICSSAPIDVRSHPPSEVIDSVGYPVGSGIRILDQETNEVLEYGYEKVGEICVKGAGVISQYVGLDVTRTHTTDGWLKTGDLGLLDKQGRLFIKGRSKDMIKRGGEQVWPNEIDDVVEKVSGVATAVTFGVRNELWGEEVAVAVVLQESEKIENQAYISTLQETIMDACRAKLDDLSMPQQIKFLPSTSCLLTGSTGKYIRSSMADHLRVTAVDTGALIVLEKIGQVNKDAIASSISHGSFWNSKCKDGRRVMPSDALNGLRFLVACFVMQVHVGEYPSVAWVKLQAYQPNMMLFFGIGAFQVACSVAQSVKGQWAHFVGSKIGSLHSLFVLSQLFTLPSYILFMAFDEEGNMLWDVQDWILFTLKFIFATISGLGHGFDVNKFTWFQSTFYMFLMLFPFMDDYFRSRTAKLQAVFLVFFTAAAGGLWGLMYLVVPSEIFWGSLYPFGWSIVTWLPLLIAAMLAAYFVRRIAEQYLEQRNQNLDEKQQEQPPTDCRVTLHLHQIRDCTKVWGYVVDGCSLVLLTFYIGVALAPNCLCVYMDTYEAMRPDQDVPEEECKISSGREDYVWTCDVTVDEFNNVIKVDPNHNEYGRFPTIFSGAVGYMRLSAPLMLLFIAAMGFGNGFTARFFQSRLMTGLSPLGYPIYLFQMGTARYYWLATRGWNWEPWWEISGEYPFPVEWYEMFAILGITIVVGFLVNHFIVPLLMPYTISWGVKTCLFVSKWMKWVTCRKKTEDPMIEPPGARQVQSKYATFNQVRNMVRNLTGMEANRTMNLRNLGLDSLGATALLGMIRASVPAAKNMTMEQLHKCETLGCLSEMIDESSSLTSSGEEAEPRVGGTPRTSSSGNSSP